MVAPSIFANYLSRIEFCTFKKVFVQGSYNFILAGVARFFKSVWVSKFQSCVSYFGNKDFSAFNRKNSLPCSHTTVVSDLVSSHKLNNFRSFHQYDARKEWKRTQTMYRSFLYQTVASISNGSFYSLLFLSLHNFYLLYLNFT